MSFNESVSRDILEKGKAVQFGRFNLGGEMEILSKFECKNKTMEITIKGNRASYQLTKRVEPLEISLIGDFSWEATSKITFRYGEHIFSFANRQALFHFCERVKGAHPEMMVFHFNEFGIGDKFLLEMPYKGAIEIGLVKSIFLIFQWVELPMIDPTVLDFENRIYNDFVIDWSNKPGTQGDIYFIEKRHIESGKSEIFQKLMDLNLLVSIEFKTENNAYKSYFIPLIKPGVSKEFYKSEFDPEGKKTYSFWKEILEERDNRLRAWTNQRF